MKDKIKLSTLFICIILLVVYVSFTTVPAGLVVQSPNTRVFYYKGHHYITFMLNNATGTNYGTVHDPDCPCNKH